MTRSVRSRSLRENATVARSTMRSYPSVPATRLMAPITRSKIGSVSSFCFFSSSLLYSTNVPWSSTICFCQSSIFFWSACCERTRDCLSISSFCFCISTCFLLISCWRLSNTFFSVACARRPSSVCMTARCTSTTATFTCAATVLPENDTRTARVAASTRRKGLRMVREGVPKRVRSVKGGDLTRRSCQGPKWGRMLVISSVLEAKRALLAAAFFARADADVGAIRLACPADRTHTLAENGGVRPHLLAPRLLANAHAAIAPNPPPVLPEKEDIVHERGHDRGARCPVAQGECGADRERGKDSEPLHSDRQHEEGKNRHVGEGRGEGKKQR